MSAATREHGLKNPRFFAITNRSEDDQEVTLRQLRSVADLPKAVFYPDGWMEGLGLIGKTIQVVNQDETWGYVFGAGIGNKDIAGLLAKEGIQVSFEHP